MSPDPTQNTITILTGHPMQNRTTTRHPTQINNNTKTLYNHTSSAAPYNHIDIPQGIQRKPA